jgi:thiol:disulfide interchange protein DsbD
MLGVESAPRATLPSASNLNGLPLAVVGLLLTSVPSLAQAPAPASEVFRLDAARAPDGGVQLSWTIAPGTYLYRERIGAKAQDGAPIPIKTAPGQVEDDPTFGPTEVYRRSAQAGIASPDLPHAGNLAVTYQGCAERGICYPPVTREIDPATLVVSGSRTVAPQAPGAAAGPETWAPATTSEKPYPALAPDAIDASPSLSGAPLSMLATFLGLGLLLAFTPCVFPMIPILSGILARSGPGLSARRGFVLSTAYVLAAAVAYAALGVVAAWSGQNLQVALQAPAVLIAMSAVFALLAASMFGLFELQLPSAWTTGVSSLIPSRGGSLGGAAAMGFTSALIVGPCVTPPLAAALIYVAQTGDVVRGASALFALGIGMGLPLIAFGTFGAGLLPRAGRWLLAVRQAFGVVFLGLAIVMLSRVIAAPTALALWGILAIGTGVFAGGTDRVAPGHTRRLGKTLGIVAIAYGITLLVGFAGGASDPFRPLGFLAGGQGPVSGPAVASTVVTSPATLEAALVDARASNKPVVVDFSAAWCSACQVFERTVLSDPKVRSRLVGATLIKADVTATDADSRELMRRFGIVGPPTMVFLSAREGREIPETRLIGEADASTFTRSLDRSGVGS